LKIFGWNGKQCKVCKLGPMLWFFRIF
jgi:hypothetical protein